MKGERKGKGRGERFIGLRHWMLDSAAWDALSGNGSKVLLSIWKRHNGRNNGQITYSAQEAGNALHASKATGWRALNELVDLGFLRVVRDSAFRLKSAEAREYALTMEPVDGRAATKDFMRWRPPATPAKNQNTVSPMKLNGFTHETVNRGIPKTPSKTNGLAEGTGSGQNSIGGTPNETAKNPMETAKNQPSTVSPVKPSEGVDGFTGETLLDFHSGSGAKAPPEAAAAAGQPASVTPLKQWRSLRFGDQAKAERIRRPS